MLVNTVVRSAIFLIQPLIVMFKRSVALPDVHQVVCHETSSVRLRPETLIENCMKKLYFFYTYVITQIINFIAYTEWSSAKLKKKLKKKTFCN